MKRSRLAAVLMVLLLAFACFLSMPVMAELPWDADSNGDGGSGGGGGTSGGGDTDTTTTDDLTEDPLDSQGGFDPYWLEGLMSRYTCTSTLFSLLGFNSVISAKAETGNAGVTTAQSSESGGCR